MHYLRLSWSNIEKDCKKIAREIRKKKVAFDLIVGLARGGLVPARLLCDYLGSDELYVVRVKFYRGVGETMEKPLVLHATQFDVAEKDVLLVDDIADTGKSLQAAVQHLRARDAGKIFVATLVKKPHSIFTPDLYVRETSAWVIFPWEVYETARSVAASKSAKEAARERKRAKIKSSEWREALEVER